jgi:DnaJ-class molecular chaperone
MKTDQARKLLSIEGIFTTQDLKAAFRRASFLCHPDTGGPPEKFQELQDAHEALVGLASNSRSASDPNAVLVDGTLLSKLGKGYPLTEAARQCSDCEGKGYRMLTEPITWEWGECPGCGGTGVVRHPCKRCQGTGKYKHPRTGKVVGDCRGCKGTGWFYPWNRNQKGDGYFDSMFGGKHKTYIPGSDKYGIPCHSCNGYKEIKVPKDERVYHTKCSGCDGVGEVKMWNPVLPRGYLAGGEK